MNLNESWVEIAVESFQMTLYLRRQKALYCVWARYYALINL